MSEKKLPTGKTPKVAVARPELPTLQATTEIAGAAVRERIDKVPLTLSVIVASTRLNLADVTRASAGDTIEFDQTVDDPVLITCNGQVIAEGEVVVVGDFYSVRITRMLDDG